MQRVDIEKYTQFCEKACMHYGFSREIAQKTAKLLVKTDRFGIFTHGTFGLKLYLDKVTAGGMRSDVGPIIEREGPGWAIIDGQNSMPIYNTWFALDEAMQKAGTTGIGYAAVKNSGHMGACGAYSVEAAEKGYIALVMSVSSNCMHIPGAKGRNIGNSPFSYAIPAGDHRPVFMDIAMSAVAGTKITRARMAGEPIPEGWIYDYDGKPTTDYNSPYAFAPMAGHKGYCLSFMVECLCAVLSGGGILSEQKLWSKADAVPNFSHCCIVIDVKQMMQPKLFSARMAQAIQEIASAPLAEGSERIYLPGEMEWERYEKTESCGLLLPDDILARMQQLAENTDLKLEDCFI
ncbi:MAG: Ldh family oxidoreductase [Clostridia bacterium]|nr:Ldh family oxidoreductase [Clostridia bacterium]